MIMSTGPGLRQKRGGGGGGGGWALTREWALTRDNTTMIPNGKGEECIMNGKVKLIMIPKAYRGRVYALYVECSSVR